MLPGSYLPTSLLSLLTGFRLGFTKPSFGTYCALVRGFVTHVGEHNVCGMLTGAGLAQRWHHSRAHRFFSHRCWSIDRLGLQLVALLIDRLLEPGAALEVAVDDTLFRRWGRKVFGARWAHDGAAVAPSTIGFGNTWVVAGIVVPIAVCRRPVCFPVLFSLWQGGPKVAVARQLVEKLAERFPDRRIHVTGDAAYVSRDLRGLPAQITWSTRPRTNAAFHGLTPPRTGRPGRPRLRGQRLPSLPELAACLHWSNQVVTRYGQQARVTVAHRRLLWYLPFGAQPVRLILVRDAATTSGYDAAIITTDVAAPPKEVIERYASRWSIEVAFEDAKQLTGVGEARNRKEAAVRRTVPFGFIAQGVLTLWYVTDLHHAGVVDDRRIRAPWYRTKETPSTLDMLATARRVLIAAQFPPAHLFAPTSTEIAAVTHAWALAAA